MRALVKRDGVVQHVTDAPFPPLKRPDDVRIRVVIAALCRTDLYAARGLLPTPDPVVLGHEFSGIIDAIGPAVTGLSPGDRVAVHPALPCGQCHPCHSGQRCPHVRFLGVHRDGAFAEAIVVPRAAVHRLPEPLSFVQGAYAEPVAASLAVLGKGPHPDERWIIYGTGRIAHLTQRILAADGLELACVGDAELDAMPEGSLDGIVETHATTATVKCMARALRPGGTLVLKSRPIAPVQLDMAQLLPREPVLRLVYYGSFVHGLELMASGRLVLDDLCGPIAPLEAWQEVFESDDERQKLFFRIAPDGEG